MVLEDSSKDKVFYFSLLCLTIGGSVSFLIWFFNLFCNICLRVETGNDLHMTYDTFLLKFPVCNSI